MIYDKIIYFDGDSKKEESERSKLESVLDGTGVCKGQLTFKHFKKFREEVDQEINLFHQAAKENQSTWYGEKEKVAPKAEVKGLRAVAFFKIIGVGKVIKIWPPPLFIPLITLLQVIIFGLQQTSSSIKKDLQFDTAK